MLSGKIIGKEKKQKTPYFDSIRKRDGTIVSFDKSKISNAIFKAAVSVGGEDRIMAEELASAVTLFLRKEFGSNTPSIERIQDVVEKVLIETGHAKTAKAYILYREGRTQTRRALRVRKRILPKADTTDISLLVTPVAKDEVVPWDKSKITFALQKEAGLDAKLAAEIASAVETKIITSGHRQISTTLIRELVDNELFERGLSAKLKRQALIGMPTYDLDALILTKSNENSNISTNNPEAVNLAIAETTLKQYVLQRVFSEDIADAHMKGMIHIHDLGYPRVYCSSHSLEYIKKYGLKLGGLDTESAPAKYARTLTGHLNTFLASMQAYYAGALGVGYINIMYAPYLEGMSGGELKQEAQHLIFSGSQNAFSRGGQSLFIDHNVHTGIPNYLKKIPAIGPKGKYTGKTYGDYEKTAQRFARAMMDVWREGDKNGKVFAFPKCLDKDTKLFARVNGKFKVYTAEEIYHLMNTLHFLDVKIPNFNLQTKTVQWDRIKASARRGKEMGIAVSLPNSITFKTTADHPHIILAKNGLEVKEARQLCIGDVLLYRRPLDYISSDGQMVKIDVFDILKKRKVNCQVRRLKNNPTKNNYAKRKGWAYTGDNIDTSWYSHIPTTLTEREDLPVGDGWKIKRHDYVCRSTLVRLPHPIILEHFIPMPVGRIEEVCVDAYALEIDNLQHTFITGDGIFTHNCDLHHNEDTFKDPAQRELLEYAAQIASENGAPYFVFDRDEVTLSACFTADTKVLITNSSKYVYEKISDIYDRIEGTEEREASQEWKIPTKRYEIINVQGGSTSVVPISGALRRRYRGVIYNVELKDGTSVSATPDHPFLVLKEGRLIRVRADKLEVGDYLPIQKKTKTNLENYITQIDLLECAYRQKNTRICVSLPRSLHLPAIYLSKKYNINTRKIKTWNVAYKSKYRYPAWLLYAEKIDAKDGKIVYKSGAQETMPTKINLSQELARLLGLYLAEGSINCSSVSFAVSQKEPAITEFIVKAIKEIFGTHVWISNDKNWKSRKIETSSKAVAWFISLFIKGNGARNKEITSLVFNATDEFKKAFIRGFLDGDGYTRESSTSVEVSFHIASEMLAKDLRALLRSIGINSTIRKSIYKNPRKKDQKLDSYHVRLANPSLYKLGWGHKYKWETLRNSHSLWKLLPAKEMGINWDRVRNAQRRGDLKRRRHSHITNFVEFYNDSEIVKYVRNGMHFLPVVGIGVSDYDGFVYDFEVNDTQHAFLLPEGLYSSNCCRLRTKIKDNYMIEHPESMRFTGFQNVTVNLPQAAYRAGKGNINRVLKEIDYCIDLAIKAHLQKKDFIARLMSEPGLPLWEIGRIALDGRPYVDLNKATYIIGIVGLNECVQFLTGRQLHEDEDVFRLGLKIISSMYFKAKESEKKLGLKFSLEESPAESATRRLAKVDLRRFPEAETVVKGDIDNDAYYYTNSIHFAPDAPVDLITRIQKQAKFHTMIESGAIIHAFVGEKLPSAKSIMNLVEKTYYNTQAAQITISPEFTICKTCNKVALGLKSVCPGCGSENVYGITRIVGYFSRVSNWNRSKLGELADRRKYPENYRV